MLRKWSLNDKKALAKLCNEVDRTFLSHRMTFPYTEKNAEEWLEHIEQTEGVDGVFRAIVFEGKIVGNASVEKMSDIRCRDAEIGYFVSEEFYSRGIATEAVREICEIAFREMPIVRITGLVFGRNIASQRVLDKNGFVLEGNLRNAATKNGVSDDILVYGKLK